MKILLIEPPVSNLEAPGMTMPCAAGALRATGHDVTQWNAGAELIDGMLTAAALSAARDRARAEALRLAAMPELDRIMGARLLTLYDSIPLADVLIKHIDAFKQGLRQSGPTAPLASLPYDPIQAALDLHTAPFFPDKISAGHERFRYNAPAYLSSYSHRSSADLAAAGKNTGTFWDGPFRAAAMPKITAAAPQLIVIFADDTNQVVPAVKLAAHIRAGLPLARVALAGAWPAFAMGDIENPAIFDHLHFIVHESCEDVLPELCKHVMGALPVSSVPGISHREASSVRTNAPPQPGKFAIRSAPDFTGYNFQHLLSNRHRIEIPFQLTHGCEWGACAFCATGIQRVGVFARQPVQAAVNKLKLVAAGTGSAAFRIVDHSLPPADARAFSLALLDEKIFINWHASVRPEPGFTLETCEIMRAAGCVALEVGVESLQDDALKRISKGLTVEQIETALRNMAAAGMRTTAHMIHGLPGTAAEEVQETARRLQELIRQGAVGAVRWNPFSLMKNSPMAAQPARFGIVVNHSPRLDASEVRTFVRTAGMNEQQLAAAWQDVNNITGRALAAARFAPQPPAVQPPPPTIADARFMSLRPRLLPWLETFDSNYSYQELRACTPIHWNPVEASFDEFAAQLNAEGGVKRLDSPRTLVKNMLSGAQYELSADFFRAVQEVKNGGTVSEIIDRLEAIEPGPHPADIRDKLLKRILSLRAHAIVFVEN